MIQSVQLRDFGPIERLHWKALGSMNLVIGGNGTGKSFLLKAMYAALRTLQELDGGDGIQDASTVLVEKLHWTFQAKKVGDLVRKGGAERLQCRMNIDGNVFEYAFGKDTAKEIKNLTNTAAKRPEAKCIFLPAKEVLSLHRLILETRDVQRRFGFDETYVDLARALAVTPKQGRNFPEFAQARADLKELLDGDVHLDPSGNNWTYRNRTGGQFPMGVTAEGIKKIAILDTLLGNRYLKPGSVVFMDEPESGLHPTALTGLLEIVALLASRGVQFVLASHSYFVLKKLHLIAQSAGGRLPVLVAASGKWEQADLADGMPENPIVEESIRLYEEEAGLPAGKS